MPLQGNSPETYMGCLFTYDHSGVTTSMQGSDKDQAQRIEVLLVDQLVITATALPSGRGAALQLKGEASQLRGGYLLRDIAVTVPDLGERRM